MKTKILKLALLSVLATGTFTMTSCVDESLNEDPKHASVLPSENFLANSLYQFSYYTVNPSVNFNNYNFFVQHWAETTYTDETNYDLITRNQPRNHYNRMMVYTIGNIKQAKSALETEGNDNVTKANKLATLEILEIMAWENIVNTFGNVPYSDAFKAKSDRNFNPKYDDAKSIYTDLIARINTVIGTINVSGKGYGNGDSVYSGNMNDWKKTANAIKLRLGINLADTDAALAKSTVESAVTSGLYQSDNESFTFTFDGGTFSNPIFDNLVASGRNDFVPSSLLIDAMNKTSDPRLKTWFTTVEGKYVGGTFGSLNPFASNSHLSDFYLAPNGAEKLISYTEVNFILAEAAARGYSVGGTALSFYEKAIKASMQESGVSDADATTYLAANPFNVTNWKKSIGDQAWVALFNRAYAAWNFNRRLDFPALKNPVNSKAESVPYRMPYSDQEYVLNATNVNAAKAAMGGDDVSIKLFWDVN